MVKIVLVLIKITGRRRIGLRTCSITAGTGKRPCLAAKGGWLRRFSLYP